MSSLRTSDSASHNSAASTQRRRFGYLHQQALRPHLLLALFAIACAGTGTTEPSGNAGAGAKSDTTSGSGGAASGGSSSANTSGSGASSGSATGGGAAWLNPDIVQPDPPVRALCDTTNPDCSDPRCHLIGSCEYSVELSCGDGFDNDNDGLLDCKDTDCAGLQGCEFGIELTCGDLTDNDGDGLSDCDDPDCAPLLMCETFAVETSCRDGADNDADGFADCKDVNCDGMNGCEFAVEVSCGDGVDNDQDGLADCYDADCVGNAVCQVVSESLCADGIDNDANGATDCADPECSGGACQSGTETSCADGIDNDGDGAKDCADSDCAASCQSSETSCGDGKDNDGDGAKDCIDLDCDGVESCEYGAELSCGDGKDNDGDGLSDCADPDCAGKASCTGTAIGDCQDTSASGCEAGTELTCNDGLDNDGDLRADCLDPDCAGKMGPNFVCQPAGETSCGDGGDNDLDGLVDCRDPDCNGLSGPSGICQLGAESSCNDGIDNDQDGFTDCGDADCDGKAGPNFTCNFRFETTCNDGFNNDGDGAGADCLDLDCVGSDQRGTNGCPSGAAPGDCLCEYETETDCNDGFDNEADGLADCDDSDCAASPACTGGSGGSSGGGSGGGAAVDFCDGGPLMVDDAGTERCAGNVAATAFRFALCANTASPNGGLTTDSFDSALGGYGGANVGDEASVGFNGQLNMNNHPITVGGSLWVAGNSGDTFTNATNYISQNAYMYKGWNTVGTSVVNGDAYLSGTIGSGLTVNGTRYQPYDFSDYPVPCDGVGGLTFDVAAMIAAFQTTNDNAQEAADIAALQNSASASVSLQCGKYYLSSMAGSQDKTIYAEGPIALFINGQVQLKNLNISLAPGASLDLFIKNGLGIESSMTVGDQAVPARTRIYVASNNLNLQGTVNLYGNIYAPSSDYTSSGANQTVYGALLVKHLNTNGNLTIHYDQQVVQDTCTLPPPPPGEHACNSCRDCANQACYDGADADNLRECTTCRSDADCCAPLVCDNSGSCVAPGSF